MGLEPYEITDENNPTARIKIEYYAKISMKSNYSKKYIYRNFYN